ncbi:MAG: cytochrome C [Candidatus Methanoperedenaceae archaeon]|nr:MAG: cytochrome C [Candidatus Methanoperedenaceae archaeon]
MLRKRLWICAIILLLTAATVAALNDKEQLGKNIFFDKKLSINENQACAACHSPQVGFTGPDSIINILGSVYEGSIDGRFGNRKPPAAAYAGDSPVLNNSTGLWIGGMFWDGRATGWTLGDPLAEQAKGPFLNPMEQGLPDSACVVYRVNDSDYSNLYKQVWGNESSSVKWPEDIKKVCSKEHGQANLSSGDRNITDDAFNNIARSIAAYERSTEVNPFTSKYDYYMKGNATLTPKEMRGLELFNNSTTARCANCHVPPLFTDFSYHNLGIPKDPMNPFYYEYRWNGMGGGINWIDHGLGEFLNTTEYQNAAVNNYGMHKVPTLRNVDKRPHKSFIKAYGHNGYFKSLKEIVHFYNTRDVPGAGWKGKHWQPAEVSANVNKDEMGNLSLTPQEESDIVAFLKTLSDGYIPKK